MACCNGLLPDNTKSSPEPMLTKVFYAVCHYWTSFTVILDLRLGYSRTRSIPWLVLITWDKWVQSSIHQESFYLSKLDVVENSQLSTIPLPWIFLSEYNFTTLEIFFMLSLSEFKARGIWTSSQHNIQWCIHNNRLKRAQLYDLDSNPIICPQFKPYGWMF